MSREGRIAALLRDAGWLVNDKRVERLWRREGLKVPMKQPKKGRLWLNPSRDIPSEYTAGQWMALAFDYGQSIATMYGRMTLAIVARTNGAINGSMHHRTDDGKAFRPLNILDEHSRECLAIRVKRKLNSAEVIDALTDLFILRGVPAYIRSDTGPLAIVLEPMAHKLASLQRQSGTELLRSVPKPLTSSRGPHGRTDTAKASTPASGMSCSMAKSSTACVRPKS